MGENRGKKLRVIGGGIGGGGDCMLSVSTLETTKTATRSVAEGDSAIVSISSDSFRKDGRTISVGDCALFKPPQDSPPFIGIISRLLCSKEDNLLLLVNWLYRPAELTLGKGILLDPAPNEIFYSFHTDEIPAASLLHRCRVAFLPKGVELPSGISSFVCRRVYDVENKCLWWLTDQDFINERQEEVDQLLYKTRIEMHATAQPGGRSPKSINGLTSTSQLRPRSDSVPNITSSPSQVKGKKRERGDKGSADPVKRERTMKTDDWDSSQSRTENSLKSEIAKITEKCVLVDFEGVEKLVHIMQPDKAEKKMDLTCRSMLAGVLAATEKFDCLNKFVELRGLPVLDKWLQDIHKGKIGDGSSSKDGDKSVEEFLLVLLRALDKLPVSLHALQMCNIGKSVNMYLSKHKSLEIQKKAKSLVETWKKRVDAEMKVIESKSGSKQTVSLPSKSRLPESHGGKKNSVVSGDIAARTSVTQLCASKASSNKASGETLKPASLSPGLVKSTSSLASVKESKPKVTVSCASDVPLTRREDKSCISSQSHNYSQSFSGKEDAKSSTAGSLSVSKVSSSGSRHQKSMNVLPEASGSGGPKETSSSRSSAPERLSHIGLTGEKALDVPVIEGSSHRLIVKIPNRGRSPAHSTSGGSFEDPSIMSSRESCQSNDVKDVLNGSNDGDGSPAGLTEEERVRIDDDLRKVSEVSKAASSSSEADTSMSIVDDVGMNLLASVAAEEMSKSDLVSPVDSPLRGSLAVEEAFIGNDARSKASSGDNLVPDGSQPNDKADGDDKKHVISCTLWPKNEPRHMMKGASCLSPASIMKTGNRCRPLHEEKVISSEVGNNVVSDAKLGGNDSLVNEVDVEEAKLNVEVTLGNPSLEDECGRDVNKSLNSVTRMTKTCPSVVVDGEELASTVAGKELAPENSDELKIIGADKKGSGVFADESGRQRHVQDIGDENSFAPDLVVTNQKRVCLESCDENKVVLEDQLCISPQHNTPVLEVQPFISPKNDTPTHIAQDVREYVGVEETKVLLAEGEQCISTLEEASSSYVVKARDTDSRMIFDLNEGFLADDGKCEEPLSLSAPAYPSNIQAVRPFPLPASSVSTSFPAPVTIAAAAKGPFVPPEDLLRSIGEIGWKGSAATSAFRPAEPRKVFPVPFVSTSIPPLDAPTRKPTRALLDFDLNVAEECVLENLASQDSVNESGSLPELRGSRDISHNELKGLAFGHSSGGFDLDLNRTDEAIDMGQYPASSSYRPELPVMPVKFFTPGGLTTSGVRRDFDLNDGPSVDDANTEQPLFYQHARGSILTQPAITGLRYSNAEIGNFASWFPPGNSYSTVTIPSILPDRMQQPFPIIPSGAPQRIPGLVGSAPFTSDLYRGSVISSSPAMPFPSSPFPYPVYQFGSTYPLPSATFSVGSTSYINSSSGGRFSTPPVNSQLLVPVDAVSSHYPRPYMVSLPEGSSAENSRKWGWQGFDLNAGPGAVEVEGREDNLPMVSNQLSGVRSQSLAEGQGNFFPVAGGSLKRMEPDGARDNDSFRHKQPSWR